MTVDFRKWVVVLIANLLMPYGLLAQGDSCSTAIGITECNSQTFSNIGMSIGTDDVYSSSSICALTIDNSMWFNFTATASGAYTVSITNISGTGSTLVESGTFSGTCGSLTPVNCNASVNSFTYSFNAVSGQTYFIVIDGTTGSDLTFDLEVCPGCDMGVAFSPSVLTGNYPLQVDFTNTSNGASFYTWDFGIAGQTYDGANSTFTYEEPGNYTVILVGYNGVCYDTASVVIDVTGSSSLTIPNIFTPNGDGINDNFAPIKKGITTMQTKIYNRWGALIGEWNGINGWWDGYSVIAGIEAAEGTYFYEIIAEGYDGKQYDEKGKVQLFR